MLCQSMLLHQGYIAQIHIDIVPVITNDTAWKTLLYVSDKVIHVLVAQFVDQLLERDTIDAC